MFNPNEPGITATDDPEIARRRGFTEYDEATGQYRAPREAASASDPAAGQPDWNAPQVLTHDNGEADANLQSAPEGGEQAEAAGEQDAEASAEADRQQ